MRDVYTKACEVLSKQLEDDLSEFKQQNNKHLQKALTRIASYYQRVKIEEKTRIKSLEAQVTKIDESIRRYRNLGTYPKYLEKKRRLSNKVEEEKNKLLQYFNKIATFENKEKKQANAEKYINNVEDKAAGRLGSPAKPVGRIHRHRHRRVSQRVEKSAPFS